MTKYKKWDIFLAKVAFEDEPDINKERPVLIIEERKAFILAHYMTSQPPRPGYKDYPICQWKEAGLNKPTTIRADKALHLKEGDILKRLGALQQNDILIFSYRMGIS